MGKDELFGLYRNAFAHGHHDIIRRCRRYVRQSFSPLVTEIFTDLDRYLNMSQRMDHGASRACTPSRQSIPIQPYRREGRSIFANRNSDYGDWSASPNLSRIHQFCHITSMGLELHALHTCIWDGYFHGTLRDLFYLSDQ